MMGLEYERYLREVVMALEEDESFRKKLEETNMTDIKVILDLAVLEAKQVLQVTSPLLDELRLEQIGLWGFKPGPTQNDLYSLRRKLDT